MQRRSLLKLAAGVAAGSAVAHVAPADAAPAEPVMVGTGCIACRPDLYPAGFDPDRLPISENHFSAEWVKGWESAAHPIVRIGGVPITQVSELMTGTDGWLIRNHEDWSIKGRLKAHLCECGSQELQVELWRGNVTQEGIVQATPDELIAAREARALRLSRFDYIEQFVSLNPDWFDLVYAEQRDYPDRIPQLYRAKMEGMPDSHSMIKTYYPGPIHLTWVPYNRQPAPTEREVFDGA